MRKFAELILKFRVPIIVATVLTTLVFGYCVKDVTTNSDILSYLPQDDPLVVLFNEVGDKFGGNSLAVVVLENGDVFSHSTLTRVDRITRQFRKMDEISHVMSLTDILDIKKTEWGLEVGKLIDKNDIPEDPEELKHLKEYTLSKDMYRGSLVSDDGEITVIISRLKEGADKIGAGRRMRDLVERTSGDERIYYGGIPFQMISLTDMIQSDLYKLIPLVIILVMVVLLISFRSLRGVFLPLSCVLMSTIWVTGAMALLKIPLTIASDGMPVLLIAVGSAYGIHMLSKYNEDVRLGDSKIQGITHALSELGVPILLAGITTLIGFLAFLSSSLSLIQEFGIVTAVGVAFAMIISVTFLPAVLSFLRVRRRRPSTRETGNDWATWMMDKLGGIVLRNAKLIVAGCVVVVVLSVIMIPRLSREVNMMEYFEEGSEIRQAEEVMEKRFGGSIPLQILVKGDLRNPFALKEIARLERFLEAQPDVHDPQSIADLICELNWVMNGHRTIPETREGVANLWFFIEGNEVLDQLVTDDGSQALIQARLGTVNTSQMLALVNAVEDYIYQELRTDLIAARFSLASPQLAPILAAERVERILTSMDWDVRERGLGWDLANPEMRKTVGAAVTSSSAAVGATLADDVATKIEDYLRGENADIIIESEEVITAIVDEVADALRSGTVREDHVVTLLQGNVPTALYVDDPEVLDYAAESIAAIIADEIKWGRTNQLIQGIKPFLPKPLADDEDFLSDLRDDVWEMNEDWTAVASSQLAGRLVGTDAAETRIELSAQQTGMPIIYMDLDRKIMRSQALSLSIAVLVVFLLLTYRLRSFVGGLISIIPIVLTILVNFTIMAILRIPLDVVTVLIGSVAVGIGIDYSIHFLTRFTVEHARGKTELEALDKTLETAGKAIIINALSVMMGFLVLVLGNIVPMQRFGYLIALTMVISAASSITVLPALILVTRSGFVGRLGQLINGVKAISNDFKGRLIIQEANAVGDDSKS